MACPFPSPDPGSWRSSCNQQLKDDLKKKSCKGREAEGQGAWLLSGELGWRKKGVTDCTGAGERTCRTSGHRVRTGMDLQGIWSPLCSSSSSSSLPSSRLASECAPPPTGYSLPPEVDHFILGQPGVLLSLHMPSIQAQSLCF